jgi:hypothetical protein
MTNEMKLLMALCDALGFEVEQSIGTSLDGVPFSLVEHTDYKLTKKSSTIAEIKAIMPSSEASYENI